MSTDIDPGTDTLRETLRDQLRRHTEELAALTAPGTNPGSAGEDPQTVIARIAVTRQAIEETNAALTRLAEGTYGRCEQCGGTIPAARLEIRPHARFCVPCQSRS